MLSIYAWWMYLAKIWNLRNFEVGIVIFKDIWYMVSIMLQLPSYRKQQDAQLSQKYKQLSHPESKS
jgi:hypothetical protein